MAQKDDLTKSWSEPPATIPTMDGVCAQIVPLYLCPSDVGVFKIGEGKPYTRALGNYVVNWGNVKFGVDAIPTNTGKAPFYDVHVYPDGTYTPYVVTIAHITDGTSHTLLMSEYLRALAPDLDWRGDFHHTGGVFRFHTLDPPNSPHPDVLTLAVPNSDPLMALAHNTPQQNAARSRHPGGVNAAFCDGSVHFITNEIDAEIWQAMGTMDGGEVVDYSFD